MDYKKLEKRLNKKLSAKYNGSVSVLIEDDIIRLTGHLKRWEDILSACTMCAQKGSRLHVVNDIVLEGVDIPKTIFPTHVDDSLDGRTPDVLIIGGGISGASIARELTKWKLDVMLVEKEVDLALHASGRNDGEVHPGVDLNKGSLKQHYVLRGNKMYDRVCRELKVPFRRCGQYVGFTESYLYPAVAGLVWHRKHLCGVKDTKILSRQDLLKIDKAISPKMKFAMYNSSAGCVCPYGLTIAYGENAVENGAQVSLSTAVTDMHTENGRIVSVTTNRGKVYPRIVINAAGTFAEEISAMAGDRFYSIHPRRGTNFIMDKKTGHLIKGITSAMGIKRKKTNTKGGGILHTVHDNLLVGPDAVETYEKENFSTNKASIDSVYDKQKDTTDELKKKDIITYFTGVRGPTFEEDFVIEKGRNVTNLLHCAGIQSPGLTAAPAIALDVEEMAIALLKETSSSEADNPPEKNPQFNPIRKGIPVLNKMSNEERDSMIRKNPDYGVIVCRCEEISKGEILDALNSPIPVPTVDGIKKRLRPGTGRCQGGFCMPIVIDIISKHLGIPPEEVLKSGESSFITYKKTKSEGGHE